MKKSIKKNLITVLGCVLCACFVFCGIYTNTRLSYAALRSSDIISETFTGEELNYRKWSVETGADKDSVKPYTSGNGVFQLKSVDTGDMRATYYFDKYVSVPDNEDMVIEYTVDDFYIGGKETPSPLMTPSSLMLVKGLGSETKEPSPSMEISSPALLEGISAFFEGGRSNVSTGYAMRSGITAYGESSSQVSVAYSNNSALKKYCQDYIFNDYVENVGYNVKFGFDNVASDPDNPTLPRIDVRCWCGEKFDNYLLNDDQKSSKVLYTQEEIDDYAIYHIFNKGFTFKHIYKSTGGYVCYVKPAGADDSAYKIYASLSDFFPGTTEKRFINRSGYVGFNVFGEDMILSLSDFNVYTVDGESKKTEKIALNFGLDEDGNRYGSENNGASDWKSTKTAIFTQSVIYDEMGYMFNNPDKTAYVYSGSSVKIKYDGLYDDYAVIDFTVAVCDLSYGKDFGLIIGGTSVDHLLNHNGNLFVYLRNNSQEANYSLGIDKIEQLTRVNYGMKKTAIEKSSGGLGDSYTVRISAKKDGTLNVIVLDKSGTQVGNTLTFGSSSNQLFLQNRIAIYCAENDYFEDGDKAVVLVKKLNVKNKYYNTINGASNVTIEEDFEGVNEKGEYKPANGVSINYGNVGSNTLVTDAGVRVENGGLLMKGVGFRSGVSSRYAYNAFDMYVDVVDMERSAPMGIGPVMFEFGNKAEGLSSGSSGGVIAIRQPIVIKDDQGNVIKRLNGDSGLDSQLMKAVANTEAVSSVAFSHDGIHEDFGFLRHNLLDPALEGHTIRFKLSYSQDGILSLAYYVMGLEDESMLNEPINAMYFEGGEGYVGVTSTHTLNTSYYANMLLDNFKVVDTDTVIEKQTVIIEDDDFDYSDYMYDFVETNEKKYPEENKEEGGCSSSVYSETGACCLAVVLAFVCVTVKRRKAKGELGNEKD